MGFAGRFGAGLPAINDGSLLFLQHMIAKMHPCEEGRGPAAAPRSPSSSTARRSSPVTPDPGPSNIRRWIIENDWLDTIVALPDQLFYNTGIFTYVWLVTNRKPPERRGKVQLIDGTRCFQTMKKSLNNKRNEITEEQIRYLTQRLRQLPGRRDAPRSSIRTAAGPKLASSLASSRTTSSASSRSRSSARLRMNFEATAERIARLDDQTAFANLAKSKKRKDTRQRREREIEAGQQQQEAIRALLATLGDNGRYMDREVFEADLKAAAKAAELKIPAPIKKAIFTALGERDPDAEICRDSKGRPEPDSELRDTENIPLPAGTTLPLPMDFGPDKPNDRLVAAFRTDIDAYIAREVLPHVPDAWVDYDKTKVGYEIPINRHFYVYKPPRPLMRSRRILRRSKARLPGC